MTNPMLLVPVSVLSKYPDMSMILRSCSNRLMWHVIAQKSREKTESIFIMRARKVCPGTELKLTGCRRLTPH